MLRNVLKLDITILAIIAMCGVPIIVLSCKKDTQWDCTQKSTEMAAWINTCDTGTFTGTGSCTLEAQKIFCKPVCSK